MAVLAATAFGASPAVAAQPRVEARAWALIDARTGEVLTSHAAARRLPIASTTKLMTAYVALRDLPLDRIVRAAPYHPTYGESLLGLRAGPAITRASAFDRARGFAADHAIPIGLAAFVILIGAALLWRRWRHRTEGEETIRVSREERRGEGQDRNGGVAE